ncbi:hypothetical protein ACX8Z9_04530 [Arthrobacter halodurans]|uniref:Uncharacterized protein n=1 Tax=Arthrobacter halodurans TaxID=516699 RepID=A0ABV4UU13_9MICC
MNDAPPAGVLAAGAYRLRTATGSAYLLELATAGSFLTRLPAEYGRTGPWVRLVPSDLRRDGERLPVLEILQLTRGQGAVFVLDVRLDGVATLRTTSPVLELVRLGD